MDAKQPATGDVVVSAEGLDGRSFTLSVAPDGPAQVKYESYDEAVKVALEWAAASGVRVWLAHGEGFEPVPLRPNPAHPRES